MTAHKVCPECKGEGLVWVNQQRTFCECCRGSGIIKEGADIKIKNTGVKMERKVKVLGVDCSLNNCGVCLCEVDEHLNIKVIQTILNENNQKFPKKMRQSFQDFKKAKAHAKFINEVIYGYQIEIVVAEIPCGSQSSRACTSAGVVTGLLGSIAIKKPLVGVTPIEVKKASVGINTASKDDIIAWCLAAHPEITPPTRKVRGVQEVLKKFEHEADSGAIVTAGVQTADFQREISLLLKNKV